ncbi:MAG TPA: hypothetical protein VJH03_25075 [Blastocatellia bacterium]|nr:hypothetical protein [Blastocatellia bacterium]
MATSLTESASESRPADQSFVKATVFRSKRARALAVGLALAGLVSGCGKPFNVKTAPDMRERDFGSRAASSGVSLQAAAITDEDVLYDTFDANLIMAGLLPMRVEVSNESVGPLNLKGARFELRQSSPPGAIRPIDARRAFKRLVLFYGVTTYQIRGYRQSEQDFLSHALDVTSPLGAGESRQGLLFFPLRGEFDKATPSSLVVRGIRIGQGSSDVRFELKLN